MSKKKIRFLYYLFAMIMYVGLFAPLLFWVIKNFDIYFVTNKSGLSVGLGGVISGIAIALLMKKGFKSFNAIFWATLFLIIVYCLNSVIKDLLPITLCAWIGSLWKEIFALPTKYYRHLLLTYSEEENRTYARERTRRIINEEAQTRGRA